MVHFLAEKKYTPTPKMLLLALCLGALVLHHSDAQGGQGGLSLSLCSPYLSEPYGTRS